jgi:dihydroflavonol-4-reductase
MSAPVLVTGATGFLGHTLCPYLVERGYRLRALVRPASRWEFLSPLGVELAWGDIRDAEAVRAATHGCRSVVHAAGKFRLWGARDEFFGINVEGTRNALEAALQAKIERFIYVSTVAVMGAPPSGLIIDETTPPDPQDPYQQSKLAAEGLTLHYHRERDLPAIVLRPGAYYGPGGRYGFNRIFFEDPLKGIQLRVHRGHRVNFPVYIEDVAQAIDLALTDGRIGEIYNISGQSLSHQEANDIIDHLLGYRIARLNAPAWSMLGMARVWTWLSRYTGREPYYPINLASYVFHDWNVCSDKARRELGFAPTPFKEGARRTLAWYRDELGISPTNWLTTLVTRLTWREL